MERFCVNGDVVGIVVVDGENVVVGGTVVVIGADDAVTGDVVLGCTVMLLLV